MNASVNEPAPQVEAAPADEGQNAKPHNKATVAPHKPRIAPAKAKSTEQAESAKDRQCLPRRRRRHRQAVVTLEFTEPFSPPDPGRVQ